MRSRDNLPSYEPSRRVVSASAAQGSASPAMPAPSPSVSERWSSRKSLGWLSPSKSGGEDFYFDGQGRNFHLGSLGPQMAIEVDDSGWRQTVYEMKKWEDNANEVLSGVFSEGSARSSDDDDAISVVSDSEPPEGAEVVDGQGNAPAVRRRRRHRVHRVNVKNRFPNLYAWTADRVGTKSSWWVVVFICIDGASFIQVQYATVQSINPVSVLVVKHASSLVLSIVLSVVCEGPSVLGKLSIHYTWRWLVIAALFFIAEYFHIMALLTGLHEAVVAIIGYIYMPLSAFLSIPVFLRPYGRLEWLAIAMMMLAIASFIIIRERCWGSASCAEFMSITTPQAWLGIPCVFFSVLASMTASTLAERIYKNRANGLVRRRVMDDPFYIMKVYLDSCALLISLAVWILPELLGFPSMVVGQGGRIATLDADVRWFGQYTRRTYFLIALLVAQGWLAGLVTKHFSTVVKALVQTCSTVLAVLAVDPLAQLAHFGVRMIPSVLMAVMVVMSALIFQTGRINIKLHWRNLGHARPKVARTFSLGRLHWHRDGQNADGAVLQEYYTAGADDVDVVVPPGTPPRAEDSEPEDAAGEPGQDEDSPTASLIRPATARVRKGVALIVAYSSILLYIGADSARTVLQKIALTGPYFVPQSMVMMQALASLALAVVMVANYEGWDGLKHAFGMRKLCRFMIPGFLTAVSSSLTGMSYALGISAALNLALGKIYTAAAALLSRWILGKYYMWLEWFAIIILIDACMTFGLLANIGQTTRGTASISAILCVLGSAVVSAVNSLIMEKLLKGDPDPFRMQLVRLNFGNLVFSILFLPVTGVLGIFGSRPDLAYWEMRPSSWHCVNMGSCDASGTFSLLPGSSNVTDDAAAAHLASEASACYCGAGVFVGWGASYFVYLALAVNVFHGLITGIMVKQFSTVTRAVADGFPILIIYFVLDPVIAHAGFPTDWARDFIALIIPLACTTFSIASHEMQEFMEWQAQKQKLSSNPIEDDRAREHNGDQGSASSDEE